MVFHNGPIYLRLRQYPQHNPFLQIFLLRCPDQHVQQLIGRCMAQLQVLQRSVRLVNYHLVLVLGPKQQPHTVSNNRCCFV